MGTCWNCNTQLSLQRDQTNCDNCGEIVFYKCNDCHQEFEVKDKKGKLEECKMCGYFKCPHCGVCSWSCERYNWEREIIKILRPEITQASVPNLAQKVREIVNYVEFQKLSTDRMNCPIRGVPVSYAKNRIKSLLAKFEGFRVKDEDDREAFLKRFDEITETEIGTEMTVTSSREKGSYGQEYRDAFNLAVCFGKFEIQKRKHKDSEQEYEVFVRCENGACPKLARDDLIINHCPNCKTIYPLDATVCSKCKPYQKGKQQGKLRELKKRLNNKDTCQSYRGSFVKNGKA